MAQQRMYNQEEKSIGDLFSELAGETGTLIRAEVALAQAELTKKATDAGKNIGFLAVGGAVAYAALLAVVAGVILGLSYFIPAWIAAVVTGLVIGIAAYILISSALAALKRADLRPNETVETLKEDAQWLKNQVS